MTQSYIAYLYIDQGHGCAAIAKITKSTPTAVRCALIREGVPMRTKADYPRNPQQLAARRKNIAKATKAAIPVNTERKYQRPWNAGPT